MSPQDESTALSISPDPARRLRMVNATDAITVSIKRDSERSGVALLIEGELGDIITDHTFSRHDLAQLARSIVAYLGEYD